MVVHAIHIRCWATTVFGGRGAGPGYTDGITFLRLNRLHAFHTNLMLPEIAKIVCVKKAFVAAEAEIRQAYRLGIRRKAGTARASNTIFFAANQETVKVKVAPIEGDLEGIVKVGNVAVTADQHPPPDRRIDLQ